MTDRLARAAGPTGAGRIRATEPITALEPATVESGRLSVELRAADRIERLDVRQFTPDWLVVEITGGWPYPPEPMAVKLEIVGPGGFVEQFRCELEFGGWVSVSGNLDGDKVGKAQLLLHCERHERSELVRVYRQLRFPSLFERGEVDADRVISLFERTGYCGQRVGLRPSAAWSAADFPPELSVDAIYCSEQGEPLGHVSVTRAYSRAWIGHQLTVLEDQPQTSACRTALYNHFATVPILIDGHQQQYLLSYYDRSKPWHQLFFESFVDWFDDRDKAGIVPFDRYEVDPRASASADEAALELDQVRPDALVRVIALVREQLSPLACAAFDIDAALLDRAYLHPDFATHGIARGRRVFVVREAGELVGVALCETGSEDLSLLNLFNLAQLYFRSRASSAAQQALVGFVRSHYRAIGQANPLLLAPAGSLAEPGDAGLELVETLGCMIWSGHTLRAYRTFLRTTFGRIERSTESARPATRIDAVYLPRVAEARARLQGDPRLAPLVHGSLGPIELLGFLLQFSALGVRAIDGERDRLLLDDLFELGSRWHAKLGTRINVELLLHQPPPRSLLRWTDLRETIARGCPTALLAVEFELASLFARLGSALLELCARTLDPDLRPSFLVAVSSDSLEKSRARLEAALASAPELVEPIAEAGRVALEIHLDILGDCVELGRELAARVQAPARPGARPTRAPVRLAFA